MTEEYRDVDLADTTVRVRKPTDSQINNMLRISSSLASSQEMSSDFFVRQINRLGTILDSLIHADDRDTVDNMVLTGQIEETALIVTILKAWTEEKPGKKNGTVAAVKKASASRVRRN
jgi:hypothetical protein